MSSNKGSKLGLGLLIGTVIGGITAFFLSPNSGKENREEVAKKIAQLKKLLEEKEIDKKVMEIFGEVSDEAKKIYLTAKEELINRLAELKETISEIDKEKYMKEVEEVMKKIQITFKKDVVKLEKLKKHLEKEWELLRK